MVSNGLRIRQALGGLLVLTFFLLHPASALAHKLYVYAQVKGTTIQGRAYFPGDVPAQKSEVIARDPSGRELGRTTTDDEGRFTFTVRERVDHCLVVQTPDNHSGQWIVHASSLPGSLPAGAAASSGASQAVEHASEPAATAGKENDLAAIRAQLAELNQQIDAIGHQIEESDERLRFRDILGGIGFILGLAGVAFYLKARGRRA